MACLCPLHLHLDLTPLTSSQSHCHDAIPVGPPALLGMTPAPAPAPSQDVAQRVTALVDRFVLCRSAQEVDVDAPRRGVQANLFDNFAAE